MLYEKAQAPKNRNSQFQKTYFTMKEPYDAARPGVFHGALYEKARAFFPLPGPAFSGSKGAP
jgi:hypothetical protein